jgi:hypothetical protein
MRGDTTVTGRYVLVWEALDARKARHVAGPSVFGAECALSTLEDMTISTSSSTGISKAVRGYGLRGSQQPHLKRQWVCWRVVGSQ